MRRTGLYVAAAIVLVANGTLLWAIRQNRTGPAEAELTLTERELRLPAPGDESGGIALSLSWRRPGEAGEAAAADFAWFDRARLESVGFDCSVAPGDPDAAKHYGFPRTLPRSAYAVLELRGEPAPVADTGPDTAAGGPKRLTGAERARLPRLQPVDVGLDADALRRRYPDRGRFLVAPALVALRLNPARGGAPASLVGSVTAIWPAQVYVPKALRPALERFQASGESQARPWAPLPHDPRYQVVLKYGSRLEPWVERVDPLH